MADPDSDILVIPELEDDDLGVQEFLDGMGQALTAGDAEAVADMWQAPAYVLGDDLAQTVMEHAELVQFFSGAREQYNARGITDTHPDIVRLDEITDRIVCVRVRWPWIDDKGREIGGETSTYTLRRDGGEEWKVRIAVMHGADRVN